MRRKYLAPEGGNSQTYKWYLTKKEDIINLIEYFKLNPARSEKKNRLHIIPNFYHLKSVKAHTAIPGTLLEKIFIIFELND